MPTKERQKEYWRKYRETHRQERVESQRRYRLKNREREIERRRLLRLRLHKEALEILGGCCVYCGFTDWRALHIDHIHGGGHVERKNKSYDKLYREIITTPDFTKYQVLCANCNNIKRYTHNEMPQPNKRTKLGVDSFLQEAKELEQ